MAAPVKLNFKIYQGSTFYQILRWESSTKNYRPITAVTKAAPAVVTAVGHGAPEGWRVKITNLVGMRELNSSDTYHQISNATADTFELNHVNALSYTDYVSGGVVEYNQPVSLSGVTARMQFREKVDSPEVLLELTTENAGILIDDSLKAITVVISAAQSALFTWTSSVYSLELVRGSDVTQFMTGTAQVIREVTR